MVMIFGSPPSSQITFTGPTRQFRASLRVTVSPSEPLTRPPTKSTLSPSQNCPFTATTSSPSSTNMPSSPSRTTRLFSLSVLPPGLIFATPTPFRFGKSRGMSPSGFGMVTSNTARSPSILFTRLSHCARVVARRATTHRRRCPVRPPAAWAAPPRRPARAAARVSGEASVPRPDGRAPAAGAGLRLGHLVPPLFARGDATGIENADPSIPWLAATRAASHALARARGQPCRHCMVSKSARGTPEKWQS
mmetsp:Transcript_44579/g.123522  ORF Transcript_44579/g.123522 Transcript_44579/m.123522 type:complete len:249 (+) Transcript_44579:502-1248(+)